MDLFEDIKAFHEKFELKYSGDPRHLPDELEEFRAGFMGEELGEYLSHMDRDVKDLVKNVQFLLWQDRMIGRRVSLKKKLDALVDLVYVALGTAYMHGFDFNEAWRRVHAANMAKVRAERADQSARGSTFDVVKPEGWVAPDLSDLV